MRDIPIFATALGVASLTLKQIPYLHTAYVRIQDTACPQAFIRECGNFCRAAGADRVYATGHPALEVYPFHTALWEMTCNRELLPDTDALLQTLQPADAERWRAYYNDRMTGVANAAYMTHTECNRLLEQGSAYYILRGETVIGLGVAADATVESVIALEKGAGADVTLALNRVLCGPVAKLTVASANTPAIRLYQRLGFVRTEEISRWYQIVAPVE